MLRRVAIGFTVALMLSGGACAEGSDDTSPEPTTTNQSEVTTVPTDPTSASEEIFATPNLARIECETVEEPRPCWRPCWLPVNPFAYLIDDLALTDKWPKEAYGSYEGDSLQVVCQTQGENIQDNRGAISLSTVWYKVIVPKDNLNIVDNIGFGLTPDDLEQTPDSKGYYGYVSAVWLPIDVVVPSC